MRQYIHFSCPFCAGIYQAERNSAGHDFKCTNCEAIIPIIAEDAEYVFDEDVGNQRSEQQARIEDSEAADILLSGPNITESSAQEANTESNDISVQEGTRTGPDEERFADFITEAFEQDVRLAQTGSDEQALLITAQPA